MLTADKIKPQLVTNGPFVPTVLFVPLDHGTIGTGGITYELDRGGTRPSFRLALWWTVNLSTNTALSAMFNGPWVQGDLSNRIGTSTPTGTNGAVNFGTTATFSLTRLAKGTPLVAQVTASYGVPRKFCAIGFWEP